MRLRNRQPVGLPRRRELIAVGAVLCALALASVAALTRIGGDERRAWTTGRDDDSARSSMAYIYDENGGSLLESLIEQLRVDIASTSDDAAGPVRRSDGRPDPTGGGNGPSGDGGASTGGGGSPAAGTGGASPTPTTNPGATAPSGGPPVTVPPPGGVLPPAPGGGTVQEPIAAVVETVVTTVTGAAGAADSTLDAVAPLPNRPSVQGVVAPLLGG